jgi:hypothetical protein
MELSVHFDIGERGIFCMPAHLLKGYTYNNPLFNTVVKFFTYAVDIKSMRVWASLVRNKW